MVVVGVQVGVEVEDESMVMGGDSEQAGAGVGE